MARPFCAYASSLLRDSEKYLEAADQVLASTRTWLQREVASSRDQLAECCVPSAKRQRVTRGKKPAAAIFQDKVRRTHDVVHRAPFGARTIGQLLRRAQLSSLE